MSVTFDAIVTDGVLKPQNPVDLPEGTKVRVVVVDGQETDGPEMSVEDEVRFWDEWLSEPSPVSDEEWEEFSRFLKEHRFNIEERLDFSSGLERGLGFTTAPSSDQQEGLSRP
jgi:predicted DNA-binding antitoxin AbrB/MazE fold protein